MDILKQKMKNVFIADQNNMEVLLVMNADMKTKTEQNPGRNSESGFTTPLLPASRWSASAKSTA